MVEILVTPATIILHNKINMEGNSIKKTSILDEKS
jgi:hypothetical protein